MIVLAVTGLMAVATAMAINGRQNVTEFQTSVSNLKTQVQQVANEVANGTFPDHDDVYCVNMSGTPLLTRATPAPGHEGDCVFVGKLLHFYSSGTTNTFTVTPLIGLNQDQYDSDPTNSYASAKLIAATPETSTTALGYGIVLHDLKLNDTAEGSFAFVQSLNNSSYSMAGGYAQHINILGLGSNSTSSSTNDLNSEVAAFKTALSTGNTASKPHNYSLNPTVSMCFNSGTTNQHATFTIDANNSNLDVESRIDNGGCPE